MHKLIPVIITHGLTVVLSMLIKLIFFSTSSWIFAHVFFLISIVCYLFVFIGRLVKLLFAPGLNSLLPGTEDVVSKSDSASVIYEPERLRYRLFRMGVMVPLLALFITLGEAAIMKRDYSFADFVSNILASGIYVSVLILLHDFYLFMVFRIIQRKLHS